MWASGLFMLFGNALIGILEGLLIASVFKTRAGRTVLFMIVANYVSMFVGLWGVSYLADWFTEIQLRVEPVQAGWRALLVAVVGSFLCSVAIEWPFCSLAMKNTGVRPGKAIRATLLAQTASYAILIPCFSLFSQASLYTSSSIEPDLGFVAKPPATVYYIDRNDGDIWSILTDGTGKRRVKDANLTMSNARLFVDKGKEGDLYDLWSVSGRDVPAQLVIRGIGHDAAPRRQSNFTIEPDSWSNHGMWGQEMEHTIVCPIAGGEWIAVPGFWGAQGITIRKGDEPAYSLVLDTPFVSWIMRNAVNLPHDQSVFQIEDMLVILDMPSRRLGFLTIGRGPVVVLPEAQGCESTPPAPTTSAAAD